MKKRIYTAILLAALLCGLAASALAATYGTVHGGWLRLRATPSYEGTVITSYKNGTVVTVLSQENGWARVMTSDYRVGYMDARYLYIGSSVTPTKAPTPVVTRTWVEVNKTAYVTSANGKGVRLRSSPEVNSSNVLGLYPVGRTVKEIRRSSDGWSYIRIDKKYGYMMTQYLMTSYKPVPVITEAPLIPTDKPTNTPVPTATPTPEPAEIKAVRLNITNPVVGQTVRLTVLPEGADYTAVWSCDGSLLLENGYAYTVTENEVGKKIRISVVGAGAYKGFKATIETEVVQNVAPLTP